MANARGLILCIHQTDRGYRLSCARESIASSPRCLRSRYEVIGSSEFASALRLVIFRAAIGGRSAERIAIAGADDRR